MARQKRWMLATALLVVSAAVAVGVVMAWRHEPAVTHENFKRLRIGMPLNRVQAVLGPHSRREWNIFGPFAFWEHKDVRIAAMLDLEDRVCWVVYESPDHQDELKGEPVQDGYLSALLEWIGLDYW
jgi:hypothetical protein